MQIYVSEVKHFFFFLIIPVPCDRLFSFGAFTPFCDNCNVMKCTKLCKQLDGIQDASSAQLFMYRVTVTVQWLHSLSVLNRIQNFHYVWNKSDKIFECTVQRMRKWDALYSDGLMEDNL